MSRSPLLANSTLVGMGFVRGQLMDIGSFPGLIKGDLPVYGELYEINDETLKQLDYVEGYHESSKANSLFVRDQVTVNPLDGSSAIQAITYLYNRSPYRMTNIPHGDYRRFVAERRSPNQWYLAYGSNMLSSRLAERVGKLQTQVTGYLEGFKLVFNKRGNDHTAKANVEYVGIDHQCPFVAYLLEPHQMNYLDGYEGVNAHYTRVGLPYFNRLMHKNELGQIYLANPNKVIRTQNPSKDYLRIIKQGYAEHGFDPDSIDASDS